MKTINRHPASDFIYQVFSLILSFIIVHTIYVSLVRPSADAILSEQLERQAAGEPVVVHRSMYVVMRDYEQEACFVLMFWAMAIMAAKARHSLKERQMLSLPLLQVSQSTSILPEDARELTRPLQALPEHQQQYLIPKSLMSALRRFGTTQNVVDASSSIKEVCDTESERLDSELAMIRYIAWAIPSIGFIGTVRGIGEALGQAHKAVEGDIVGVTVSLGVAFNSTFVALIISIVIMFFSHQLQLLQERLVLDTQEYCDKNLLRHLKIRSAQ